MQTTIKDEKLMAKSIKGTQTEINLMKAFAGESQARMHYNYFASVAKKESFPQIVATFEAISVSEKQHDKRFKDLAENLEAGKVFKRNGTVTWRCLNCGYLHEAEEAPEVCPACLHPQAYFEILGENW